MSTNASGAVFGQQGDYPFGQSWYSSNGNEFAFTSYQYDSPSGLSYALARYYDAGAGRFCSADPVAGSPDTPQTWNRYAYAGNDPIDNLDPSGQAWWNWLLDIGGIAAGIFAPELDPLLAGAGSAATAGEVTSTVFYGGEIIAQGSAGYGWAASVGSSIVAGAVGAQIPQPNNSPQTPQTPTPKTPCAISAKSLDNYLTQKHSPLAGQGANLMAAGQRFNVDPRFVVALAGAETTFGTVITRGANNAWNWLYNGPGKQAPFQSYQSGITSVSRGLGAGRNYLNGNPPVTTTDSIYGKYCTGTDCANGIKNLNTFMKEQHANPSSLRYPCKD